MVAYVLERLEAGAPGVQKRQFASETRVPGKLLHGLGLGIALGEPHLRQGVFSAHQLVEEFGSGVIGEELLEAVIGADVFLALVLRFGNIILGLLAPVRSLAVLGNRLEGAL